MKGHPNGHEGSYKKRARQERALARLRARLASATKGPQESAEHFKQWLASSRAEEKALAKTLGQL